MANSVDPDPGALLRPICLKTYVIDVLGIVYCFISVFHSNYSIGITSRMFSSCFL